MLRAWFKDNHPSVRSVKIRFLKDKIFQDLGLKWHGILL
jgi:hypothetical protein